MNIFMSSANKLMLPDDSIDLTLSLTMSLYKILKRQGPSMLPCGTPLRILTEEETVSLMTTR